MRYLLLLLLLPFLLTIIIACNHSVVFMEPQPEGKKDLSEFPEKFRGFYMDSDDSSLYLIESALILEKYEENLEEEVAVLLDNENIELHHDTLVMLDMNLSFPVKRRNDSVFGFIEIYDTVFSIARGDRLRKLKKDYFLNIQQDSTWLVLKLSFDHSGHVFLFDIEMDNEIDIFRQNTDVEIKTDKEGKPVQYFLAPTRKELKKLIRLKTFTDTTEYYRVYQENFRQ